MFKQWRILCLTWYYCLMNIPSGICVGLLGSYFWFISVVFNQKVSEIKCLLSYKLIYFVAFFCNFIFYLTDHFFAIIIFTGEIKSKEQITLFCHILQIVYLLSIFTLFLPFDFLLKVIGTNCLLLYFQLSFFYYQWILIYQ